MSVKKNDIAVRLRTSNGGLQDAEFLRENIVGKLIAAVEERSTVSGGFPYGATGRVIPMGKWRKATTEETAGYFAGARHISEVKNYVPGYVENLTVPKNVEIRDDRGRYAKSEVHKRTDIRQAPYFVVGQKVTYLDYKYCTNAGGIIGNFFFGGGSDNTTGVVDEIARIEHYEPKKGCYKVHTKLKGYSMVECEFLEYDGPAKINTPATVNIPSLVKYKADSKVIFKLGSEEYRHTVNSSYLTCNSHAARNDAIFQALNMNAHMLAKKAYGYAPVRGGKNEWPEYKSNDFAAASRLIDAVHHECEMRNDVAISPMGDGLLDAISYDSPHPMYIGPIITPLEFTKKPVIDQRLNKFKNPKAVTVKNKLMFNKKPTKKLRL
jgi:hypothetical protein